MDLNDALKVFEATEANLVKMERLWDQLKKLFPTGLNLGVTDPDEYVNLTRAFANIARAMPAIDGRTIQVVIMDPDAIVQNHMDYLDVGEASAMLAFHGELESQGRELGDYRFLLDMKRRELARQSIQKLSDEIDAALTTIAADCAPALTSNETIPEPEWSSLRNLFKSVDSLLGSSISRGPRWSDMARHLGFGQRHDFDDIVKYDWPQVRQWLQTALYDHSDPLPIAAKDLGELVRAEPRGPVATELLWSSLSPSDFERLVFNLVDRTRGYENPKWLTHTNAPDRGRDISVERRMEDPLTGTRAQRIILACRRTDSVNVSAVADLASKMSLWEPPRIDELIVVTSGRFTTDAVDYVESQNLSNAALRIEMWPNSHLERLLANRPELIAEFHLRD